MSAAPPVEAAEEFTEHVRRLGVSVESVLAVPGLCARLRVETTRPGEGRTVVLLDPDGNVVTARGDGAELVESRVTHRGRLPVYTVSSSLAVLAGNETYRRLLDLEGTREEVRSRLATDPRLEDAEEASPFLLRVLDHRETTVAALEHTLRLLDEVAAGTPLEWALRHLERGATS